MSLPTLSLFRNAVADKALVKELVKLEAAFPALSVQRLETRRALQASEDYGAFQAKLAELKNIEPLEAFQASHALAAMGLTEDLSGFLENTWLSKEWLTEQRLENIKGPYIKDLGKHLGKAQLPSGWLFVENSILPAKLRSMGRMDKLTLLMMGETQLSPEMCKKLARKGAAALVKYLNLEIIASQWDPAVLPELVPALRTLVATVEAPNYEELYRPFLAIAERELPALAGFLPQMAARLLALRCMKVSENLRFFEALTKAGIATPESQQESVRFGLRILGAKSNALQFWETHTRILLSLQDFRFPLAKKYLSTLNREMEDRLDPEVLKPMNADQLIKLGRSLLVFREPRPAALGLIKNLVVQRLEERATLNSNELSNILIFLKDAASHLTEVEPVYDLLYSKFFDNQEISLEILLNIGQSADPQGLRPLFFEKLKPWVETCSLEILDQIHELLTEAAVGDHLEIRQLLDQRLRAFETDETTVSHRLSLGDLEDRLQKLVETRNSAELVKGLLLLGAKKSEAVDLVQACVDSLEADNFQEYTSELLNALSNYPALKMPELPISAWVHRPDLIFSWVHRNPLDLILGLFYEGHKLSLSKAEKIYWKTFMVKCFETQTREVLHGLSLHYREFIVEVMGTS